MVVCLLQKKENVFDFHKISHNFYEWNNFFLLLSDKIGSLYFGVHVLGKWVFISKFKAQHLFVFTKEVTLAWHFYDGKFNRKMTSNKSIK